MQPASERCFGCVAFPLSTSTYFGPGCVSRRLTWTGVAYVFLTLKIGRLDLDQLFFQRHHLIIDHVVVYIGLYIVHHRLELFVKSCGRISSPPRAEPRRQCKGGTRLSFRGVGEATEIRSSKSDESNGFQVNKRVMKAPLRVSLLFLDPDMGLTGYVDAYYPLARTNLRAKFCQNHVEMSFSGSVCRYLIVAWPSTD